MTRTARRDRPRVGDQLGSQMRSLNWSWNPRSHFMDLSHGGKREHQEQKKRRKMVAEDSHDMTWGTREKRLRQSAGRSQERLLRRELGEGILCGQAIPVTVTDLLEKNCLILVENER